MARIRSIHPGIWTDEAFMEASAFGRLLIFGLWNEAFDDGVFAWKPLTIKARIFPVDNVDIDELLLGLERLGVIRSFMSNGKRYGAIRNFQKYQRPKKPNSSGALSDELAVFVGKNETASEIDSDQESLSPEPVPNQFRTSTEISSQREDGGGRREDGGGKREEVNRKEEKEGSLRSPSKKKSPPEKRACRLPVDWSPSDSACEFAKDQVGDRWRIELEKFRDYWIGKSGKDATKLDWDATWRNWIRNSHEKIQTGSNRHERPNALMDAIDKFDPRKQSRSEADIFSFGDDAPIIELRPASGGRS